MEEFHKNLYSFRINQGLTLEEFAGYLGVTTLTLHNWEKGRNKPSPRNRKKVLDAMGVLGIKGVNRYIPRISQEEADIISEYSHLEKHEILSVGFMSLGKELCNSIHRPLGFVEAVLKGRWEVVDKETLDKIY